MVVVLLALLLTSPRTENSIISWLLSPRWPLTTRSPTSLSLLVYSRSSEAPPLVGSCTSCVRKLPSTHSRNLLEYYDPLHVLWSITLHSEFACMEPRKDHSCFTLINLESFLRAKDVWVYSVSKLLTSPKNNCRKKCKALFTDLKLETNTAVTVPT